jgi:hypothetical protein
MCKKKKRSPRKSPRKKTKVPEKVEYAEVEAAEVEAAEVKKIEILEKKEIPNKPSKILPIKEYLGGAFQKRIQDRYMHYSRKSGLNAPVENDFHLKNLVLNYLNGRIFKAHRRILYRDDVIQCWVQDKAEVLSCLQVFIEGQNFKKLNAKGELVDYFRSLGDIVNMANTIYNYREVPEFDEIDNFILKHCANKINYLDGWTYHIPNNEFYRTRTQEYYYLNTGFTKPTYNEKKATLLFNEIHKVFGDNTAIFLAHFSRIMSGQSFIDKVLTLVTGPRHSAKGTVLQMFSVAFGRYVSTGPMNFFLCHQNDKISSDPESLNKYIANILGISTCRMCYSTEMASKDEDSSNKIYNPVVINGSYSRSLNGGGDLLAVRKLYANVFMAIQVACLVLQSNAIYPSNPAIASDTVVFIRTVGKFLNKFDYEEAIKMGGKDAENVYLRDSSFRANLVHGDLCSQLPFLLSEYHNKFPIKFPKNFFFRQIKRDTNVLFVDVVRKFISPEKDARTPAWQIRKVVDAFKNYLPQKITPHGFLQLLYPDHDFISKKKTDVNPEGHRETLSCRMDLKLDAELFKIIPVEEINKLSEAMEERDDLRASKENTETKVDCTNPLRNTPYSRTRVLTKEDLSPAEVCRGSRRNLFE